MDLVRLKERKRHFSVCFYYFLLSDAKYISVAQLLCIAGLNLHKGTVKGSKLLHSVLNNSHLLLCSCTLLLPMLTLVQN